MSRLLLLSSSLLFLSFACGEDKSSGGPDGSSGTCPNLAGNWTIAEHCSADFIGTTQTITQTGCAFGSSSGSARTTVNADGSFSLSDTYMGNAFECTGTATATRITQVCTGDCNVVLTKAAAGAPSTSSTIDAAGGTVALGGSDLVVTIPPGALAAPTTIGVAEVSAAQVAPLPFNRTAYSPRYALTPHGTTFAAPVEIAVRFSGDAASAQVLRLDDEADPDWEVVEGATFEDGIARFATNRFSVIIMGGPFALDCGYPGERCCDPGGPLDDLNLNGCDDVVGGGKDVCDEGYCSDTCRGVVAEAPPTSCATSPVPTEYPTLCGSQRLVCQDGVTERYPENNGTVWYCCD